MGDKELQEVKPLREVPRAMEHCGRPMRRMAHPGVTGGLKQVLSCETCGTQQKLPDQETT